MPIKIQKSGNVYKKCVPWKCYREQGQRTRAGANG